MSAEVAMLVRLSREGKAGMRYMTGMCNQTRLYIMCCVSSERNGFVRVLIIHPRNPQSAAGRLALTCGVLGCWCNQTR